MHECYILAIHNIYAVSIDFKSILKYFKVANGEVSVVADDAVSKAINVIIKDIASGPIAGLVNNLFSGMLLLMSDMIYF